MDAISPFSPAERLNPTKSLAALRDFAAQPSLRSLGEFATTASDFAAAVEDLRPGKAGAPALGAGFAPLGPSAALGLIGFALSRAAQVQEAFAGAPPAPPTPPASRAPENLPHAEDIRAAYGLIARIH